MIDLHCHSTCSDGIFSPIELLKMAEENKLDYFSITDHDSVDAYRELLNIDTKKYFSGKIILGAELRFLYQGVQLELLCYAYDFDKIKDVYWVQKDSYHNLKKALLSHLLEKAKLLGFVYPHLEYDGNVKPETMFYKELIKNPANIAILDKLNIKHGGDFYRKLIADTESILYFDSTKYSQTLEELADLIHSCGGIAVLAHPFGVYKLKNPQEAVQNIASSGKIDGIECMHADMTEENTKFLLELCKKHNLVSTGGSDFHGYNGQKFARANHGTKKIPTTLIEGFLKRINSKNIIG